MPERGCLLCQGGKFLIFAENTCNPLRFVVCLAILPDFFR